MKRNKILFFAILFVAGFNSQINFAQPQAQLYIDQIDSINDPIFLPDTVYEGQLPSSFRLRIRNFNTNPYQPNAYLKLYLRNTDTTGLTQPQELLDSSLLISNLVGLDTFYVFIPVYNFTSSTYRLGNNIVVVWSRLDNDTSSTYDSLQLDPIYFIPLSSLSLVNIQNKAIFFFPNPVIEGITLIREGKKPIDYVRILNDLGQEILFRKTFEDHLDIHFLSEGFYFIEIKERNGTILRKKFLKL
jgi:hypothetical protein